MHTDGPAPQIIDKQAVARNVQRALNANIAGADFLLTRTGEDIAERITTVKREFTNIALIDFANNATDLKSIASAENITHASFSTDERLSLAPNSTDLAISVLSLQFFNDLPGALSQIRQALKPDGLFLGALIGGASLHELRTCLLEAEASLFGGVHPRVLPFADVKDMGGLLQRAGFALPVSDVDTAIVRYDNMFALMADLRAMGAANCLVDRPKTFSKRALFLKAAELYADRFADPDGRIRATFQIISLSGWAPHESQQKPLKPGSAQISLTKILEK